MRQNKQSTKKYTTKEIFDLLDIDNSEIQKNDSDFNQTIENNNNNEIFEKENNIKNYNIEKDELCDIEKEISLFETEENQFNLEDNNISDTKKNHNSIAYLLNPDINNDPDSLFSKINNSSEELDNDEENEYLGYNKDTNDKFINESKKLNVYTNTICDEKGSLNNLNNPFIRAMKEVESNKYIYNNEENIDKNYEGAPQKFFDKSNAILLDKNFIEENNLIGNISETNHWFNNIIYKGKKFNTMSNYKNLNNSTKVSYFCALHRTTKGNEKLENKGKNRISKCNARIVYIKHEGKYYMDWEHSEYCKKDSSPILENYSDINKEIKNYKSFRNYLNEFLNANPMVNYKTFKEKANIIYYKINCTFEIKKTHLRICKIVGKKLLIY